MLLQYLPTSHSMQSPTDHKPDLPTFCEIKAEDLPPIFPFLHHQTVQHSDGTIYTDQQ